MTKPGKRILSLAVAALAWLGTPAAWASTAIDSLRQAVTQATGDQKTQAYKALRAALIDAGDADQLLAMLEQWAAFERQRGNDEEEGKVRWNKITLLSNYSRDDALLAEAPLQMSWFKDHADWEHYYGAWECMASTYLYTGKAQTALHEAQQMLADAKDRNNDYGRVVSYQLSGIIYETMGQNEPAIDNLQHALDLLNGMQRDDNSMLFSVYDYLSQTLGSNSLYMQELNTTDSWLRAIDEQRRRSGEGPRSLAGTTLSCYVQRTDAFMGLGRLDDAADALNTATSYLEYFNIPLTQYRIRFTKARLLLKQGHAAEAVEYLDSLDAMEMEAGGSREVLRAQAYMQLNRYAEAAELYRQQYEELDSMFSRDMRTQLDELATLYKLDEQEMRNALERAHTRNIFIYAIIGIVVLALLAFIVMRNMAARRLAQKNKELEEANNQLRLANQRAEDSSKMKTDFIKSISHEIRTPLNILSGFTQIITSPGMTFEPDQLADIHKRINENTDRIVKLMNKMLELSDANTHNDISRDDQLVAADIAADTIRQMRMESTSRVAFEWDADSPLAQTPLLTNRTFAVRALTCLLDNAQKFTREGMIALRLQRKGNSLLFVVEDTGIGVAPEKAETIFEEFYQIDKYSEGAGIGLTVARSIARRLGGDIQLDTHYTAGSRFIMSLPLS